jgi:uncharacterized protein (TIGR03435 family)
MMLRRVLVAAALLLSVQAATPSAQLILPEAAEPFEVASVKFNTSPPLTPFSWRFSHDSVQITNLPLREIILQAYDLGPSSSRPFVDQFRLIGGDNKILSARFDILAKAMAPASAAQLRAMLRKLLTDRFQLRLAPANRPLPVYELKPIRNGVLGPNLRPSPHDCLAYKSVRRTPQDADNPRDAQGQLLCWPGVEAMGVRGIVELKSAGTIDQLINSIQRFLDRPIVAGGGLPGTFEWKLRFANSQRPEVDTTETTLFTALSEQLGLKLEARSQSMEVLSIDSVQMPTPD